jgi:hypothetical protein
MVDPKEIINKIAKMLTDDPDIFNEMAVSTGAIAMPLGGNIKKTKKRKRASEGDDDVESGTIKKYFADPVTGQSKAKTKSGKDKKAGEVLFADTQSEETDESVD